MMNVSFSKVLVLIKKELLGKLFFTKKYYIKSSKNDVPQLNLARDLLRKSYLHYDFFDFRSLRSSVCYATTKLKR